MRSSLKNYEKSHWARSGSGQSPALLAICWACLGFVASILFWSTYHSASTNSVQPNSASHALAPSADYTSTDQLQPNANLPLATVNRTSVFSQDNSLPTVIAPVAYYQYETSGIVRDVELPAALETIPLVMARRPQENPLSQANKNPEVSAGPTNSDLPPPKLPSPFPVDVPSVPSTAFQVTVVPGLEPINEVHSNPQSNLITVSVRGAALHSVLSLVAEQQGLSIAASSALDTPITLSLQPTTLENALNAITAISGCTWSRVHDVIYVTSVKLDSPENFMIQGRELRVFNLGYASAVDVEKTITGLLSPIGKVFVRVTDSKDKRKTIEQIVVEDMPDYVARIADFLSQTDLPPRQVMVEARILQVKLENDNRHGVNFDTIARISGADVTLKSQALATGLGTAGVVTVDGTNFNSLLDCLVTNNDAKTLAKPKLMMINGQESKIQIGRRLGFFVTTTTQTSTLQDVQFLEVGVVLSVTPQITEDGRIVMKVHPKVSNGDINPATTLPEEETTEVDTSIMVADGRGVIIGGLIQEIDNERQSKLPLLGDLWLVGRLFQRRVIERERNEVIVALLPRIVPLDACLTPEELAEFQRVDMPLLTPMLESAPRPEVSLHDAVRNPIRRTRDWLPR